MHCDSQKKTTTTPNEQKTKDRKSKRARELEGFDLQPRYIQLIISKIEPISEFDARKYTVVFFRMQIFYLYLYCVVIIIIRHRWAMRKVFFQLLRLFFSN